MSDSASPSAPDRAAVGSSAPGFELRDQNHQVVSLDKLRADRAVLIVFFPLAFTGTCQGELGYIRDHLPRFDNDAVTTVAVSVGPSPTHKVWSSAQGFLFPILSDFWPHGEVARAYGVFNEQQGIANRGTFVVDRDGTVVFSDMVGPGEVREADLWDKALAALD
ncbi:alkyl hydroperoxide reductase/ Thiol specific antioxidant/ Mal allergen [Gordonia bronchialis DSM 43247]|uniref:Alkyl hydroperoxide reductase E n=1 Tax=Gordonia bronchialis (strain ATCC 25592 / DSM 43247 / BCRC 13721 / JCM 3198 / KCTC 3076 / NBRC 16047 / NCTC 10667) TaxID=526226 RepID=D0LBT5_GORB4|nr:peroxiredoxin [Gordonia bronchialis]ACY22322.1 alkyl hydroperoxide reductase/ Thiol specific antioxidant/ Mal allergen [Gordonia bronchialis DSM 43247]MCC3325112.1 peroxiredoxin [Gordonia bronchialis]QGS24148.1 redoxin domain-containing protein [Gordonia bronchialis]UAK39667.1 peroxiredoxin [Gordonia bronchialis]STQ65248.1 Putative peroxiredoxin Rv2238c/MT2298 [Gordonia bronchialis]